VSLTWSLSFVYNLYQRLNWSVSSDSLITTVSSYFI
jgi:hypothetical protein